MQVVCPACFTRNRVPDARAGDDPTCGRCHVALLPTEPVALADGDADRYLRFTEAPVVIDFWADWCGPCRMMAPAFAQAAGRLPQVRFVKIDSDRSPGMAARFGIRSLPTLVLTRQGEEIARHSGLMPVAQVEAWVRAHAA